MKEKLGTIILTIGIIAGLFASVATFRAKQELNDRIGETYVLYSSGVDYIHSFSGVIEEKAILKKLYVVDGCCGTAIVVGIVLLVVAKKEKDNIIEENE